MAIRPELEAAAPLMQAWRRDLHAHPELAHEEFRTADFVAAQLSGFGIEVFRDLTPTAVVGRLRCGSSARAIGLRADMDALPVLEQNTFAHRSRTAGKMHACGHDGHTAMLLGAAQNLAARPLFDGVVYFIFQPAEEDVTGARLLMEAGLFDRFPMGAVYGLHNYPLLAEGNFAIRAGPMMASADTFDVLVRGRGGHGAFPHLAIDTISVAAQIVLAFERIAARRIDPLEPAVISVTRFHAGEGDNVLPAEVVLGGSTRSFSEAVRDTLEASMRQACEGLAAACGAEVAFDYHRRCPPVLNHPSETETARAAAASVVGTQRVHGDEPPVMASEDFAWMLRAKPGAYVLIGGGPEHQGGCMVHNPGYDFNDRILSVGASYWVELVEHALPILPAPVESAAA